MRITRLLYFMMTFGLIFLAGCVNEADEGASRNNEDGLYKDTDLERTTYEVQMFGSDLQAINEDFNADSVRGEPSYPKEGITSFDEQGDAIYDNEAVIDRNGMMSKAPEEQPVHPNQYRAFIRSSVNRISQEAVYTDGRKAEITKEFYEATDNEVRNITPVALENVQRDIDAKLKAAMDCYEVAGFNPALQDYFGGIISVLKEAGTEGNYEKYVNAVKKIQSLNGVINVK